MLLLLRVILLDDAMVIFLKICFIFEKVLSLGCPSRILSDSNKIYGSF